LSAQLCHFQCILISILLGTLSFLQEIIGSNVAGIPVQRPSKNAPFLLHVLARAHINLKALKLALYGFFIAAPLNHYGVGKLQAAFAGKSGAKWRIAQILASNLLMAPIQTAGT
jgi:peroxisomal membrane protein 2